MKDFNKLLNNYAKLIVEKGANVQKDRPVMINCPVDQVDFARRLAKKAYENGASHVEMRWRDDIMSFYKFQNAPLDEFKIVPKEKIDLLEYYYKKGACVISVVGDDPNIFQGVDPEKLKTSSIALAEASKPLMAYTMNDEVSWCVAAAANKAWAKSVFPELKEEEAVMKLWKKILHASRADGDDPVKEWDKHVKEMDQHADFLNEKQFKTLHYTNSLGTDVTIELPKGHCWVSAGSVNSYGDEFIANIPTEEVFTLPKKDGVNGVVYSSKPLIYNGTTIDEMRFVFKDGKCIEYDAKKGKDALDALFSADENARFLGEVALVPYHSPISMSHIIYKTTLFDENAACHLAFGNAYPSCIEGGKDMMEEELNERGVNDSLVHEDFMIGTRDLNIIGITTDGEEIEVFRNGDWA